MPYLALVSDVGRIETLAQVGLVFLMFSIGLRLSLRKLRRLGLPLLAAVFGGRDRDVLPLAAPRGGARLERDRGPVPGRDAHDLLVGSIIGKILHETGPEPRAGGPARASACRSSRTSSRSSCWRSSNSVVQLGGAGASHASAVGTTLLHLGAFVAMIGVAGLILVPWLLKRMSISMDEELQTLGLAALLFGLAILAQKAGYSAGAGRLPARDHRGRDAPPPPGRAHVRGDARRVQRRVLRRDRHADRRPRARRTRRGSSRGSPRSRSLARPARGDDRPLDDRHPAQGRPAGGPHGGARSASSRS